MKLNWSNLLLLTLFVIIISVLLIQIPNIGILKSYLIPTVSSVSAQIILSENTLNISEIFYWFYLPFVAHIIMRIYM